MSVESWARRASGLLLPKMSLNPLGRFQVCKPGECCVEGAEGCQWCDNGLAPEFVELTIAGVTDGPCTPCSIFNTTHLIQGIFVAGGCVWNKQMTNITCIGLNDNAYIGFGFDGAGLLTATLQAGFPGGGWAEYEDTDPSASDCMNWANEILTKVFEDSFFPSCNTWPATISVSAV